MELQFGKEVCPCLHFLVSQAQSQEQTQEVRLPDGMPDVGRVLGAWGQVLIRGKEWRSIGMTVSGGVLAWALYVPEDGSEPRMLDTWIPFQMKWDFPESQRDGTIHVWPLLESMDARCVSARKILFRSTVSMLGEAMEPSSVELYRPGSVPEDVQLLKNTYPTVLPVEAGEKQFLIQEDLEPGTEIPKILRYCVKLQINEQRVMANRLVFRGTAYLQILCGGEKISPWNTELPYSQYVDLDGSYGDQATASIRLIPTALELEKNEQGVLQLKCGVAAQYVICERVMVDAVEDAYSPFRSVEMQKSEWELPALLDTHKQPVTLETPWKSDGMVVDTAFYCGYPQIRQDEDLLEARIPGQFQILYTDEEGQLQGSSLKGETQWQMKSDKDNRHRFFWQSGFPSAESSVDGYTLRQEMQTETDVYANSVMTRIIGLGVGETSTPDPARPALILRRCGGQRLWDIAKSAGSTVDAIQKANGITEEPDGDRMLLIPVI